MLGNPHVRAGDADREQMAAELGRHCAEGRLSAEELSERVEAAYRARTLGQLGAVASDLPMAGPTRPTRRRRAHVVLAVAAVCVLALGAVGLLEAVAEAPEAALMGLIVLGLVTVVMAALLIPALVTAAPLLALAAAVVWAARRLGALERPTGHVVERR